MIFGVGIDVVEISRIKKTLANNKFAKKILTPAEHQYYQNLSNSRKIEFLAGRFAAKEAFAKALGCGIGKNFSWQDLSILPDKLGAPICSLSTKLPKKFPTKLSKFNCSISHTKTLAQAIVIIST